MLPYLSRRVIKYFKMVLATCLGLMLLIIYQVSFKADVAVNRFPPQRLPYYQCPRNLSSGIDSSYVPISSNLTEKRALVLIESAYSRHGKLILQFLSAVKFPYKSETFSKNLPLLTTTIKGRFSFIIIENYYKYLNMPKWNRQLIDKYCIDYQVPIISFLYSRQDGSYQRAKIKGSSLHIWQNQQVISLKIETSHIHKISRIGMERTNIHLKEWVLFEKNDKYETLLSACDSFGRSRAAVLRDSGEIDGVNRVLFGHNLTDWTVKMTFLDVLWFVSGGAIGWGQERYIQVDIDDIFVGARGTRMVEADVRALLTSQNDLRKHISNFTYMLGFSGSYFRNGDDNEDKGDELLVEFAYNFIWFPHMWRHNHAHEHNYTYMEATMTQNRMFAQNMHLPIKYPYAIAPQHDGVYPVHSELYDAWRKVWELKVTATEEYPHFKPAFSRKGFVHKGVSVLPRQTCGLYTHTQFFHNYPGGFSKLINLIQGGDLFFTVLLNPISIFMTHQQNFAHDRLAIYTFENLFRFIRCWTNIRLLWQDPLSSAALYFNYFPQDKIPVWNNPCLDNRHRAILPPSLNCSNITLPNVLIVGPQKTGSTALASFLSLHPNTSTNRPILGSWEELQFFGGTNYHEGIEWYTNKFKPSRVVFEKSATYFDNWDSARQVATLIPDAKIIVILYDPAKRAYSWYQHLLAHNDLNAISAGSLEGILDGQSNAVKKIRQRCISGGRYTHHLDRWLELFPATQLILIDGERLREEPIQVLTDLTEQLGLPYFDYSSVIRFNPLKRFYCEVIRNKTKCLGRSKGRIYPPMSLDLSVRLNKIFMADNTALHKFLIKNGYPVPNWLPKVLDY